ncbi:MAG: four helix bundle protein [Pseudomonadota bacterium]
MQEKIKTCKDLVVFTKSFESAMGIFRLTGKFPKEERYSLIDQMRRSSRSIPANIAECWAKRRFENVFKRHLLDSIGSCEDVKVWLDFASKCKYIDEATYQGCYEN